jgi:hypothetical protein
MKFKSPDSNVFNWLACGKPGIPVAYKALGILKGVL